MVKEKRLRVPEAPDFFVTPVHFSGEAEGQLIQEVRRRDPVSLAPENLAEILKRHYEGGIDSDPDYIFGGIDSKAFADTVRRFAAEGLSIEQISKAVRRFGETRGLDIDMARDVAMRFGDAVGEIAEVEGIKIPRRHIVPESVSLKGYLDDVNDKKARRQLRRGRV